ncbi:glucose/arabinose dehydrogenase [Kibdelosporangium banguiense]|uniref:Glucose/arabinose dehydrogenase n=1 Tax=Kibdelosporangium banguiense TaxID=1365924 RepID=A0ABS4TIA1_9PSEU|nr:PQQ-dependent sugar dehydrogenase [Kibdelosporangium banguiense]MBP2323561.1 glucose/arabinose dehydrogenase [Kibdelosporangium banguiense]
MVPLSRWRAGAAGVAAVAMVFAVAPAVSAAPVLLSQNKPVTVSTTGGDNYAGRNAVDGSTSTRWASQKNIDPAWIYVDLGAVAAVSQVKLTWDQSCAKSYRVELSTNATNWSSIYETTTGDGSVDDLAVGGNARYVRVYGTVRCRTGSAYGYSLQEFQVYGTTGPDTESPTTPGNVRASDIKSTSATLSWDASTDNVGVTAYDIFNTGQLVKTVSGTTLSTTLTGLTPNTNYGFYVNARDGAGNVSQASDTVPVKTPPQVIDNDPPTAPGNLRSTGTTANSVALTWNASTDNIGVTGYQVFSGGTQVGSATGTTATISGLKANTAYTFTAKATDDAGNVSPASNAVTVTTKSGGDAIGEVKQITTSTDVPWGLVNLPDGSALYNERDTHKITRVTQSGTKTTVGTISNVSGTDGEGGLLGLEISPDFATDHWLYVYHTSPNDNRIIRVKYENGSLGASQVLLTGIVRNKFHNGGRLRFGPDGKLYAGVGDGQSGDRAQDLNSLNGKILRLNPDGSVPSDNPFAGKYVWSYGHRNIEGLAFDSQGRLWEAELGNSVMDELNLIKKGGNYGWPSCEGTSGSGCSNSGYTKPVRTWGVSSASPGGLAIVNDTLFMSCLRGERLYRMKINGNGTDSPVAYFQGTYGRLRTVEPTSTGGLWLTTSNGDKDSTGNNSNTKIMQVALN